MYINAHDHLRLYKDLDKELKLIEEKKIMTLAVSMDLEDYIWLEGINSPYIKKGFGIHPWKVELNTSTDKLEDHIMEADFIGEIGLDFFWDKRKEVYPKQVEIFDYFIYMAKKHDKVANIHTKGAEKEVLEILEKYQVKNQIIHWYSGDLDLLDRFLALDCYFTIGPDIGYSDLTDRLIKKIPLNRLLSETDGPSSLEWVNGQYGRPSYVIDIVSYIATIKGLSPLEVKDAIGKNYKKILG